MKRILISILILLLILIGIGLCVWFELNKLLILSFISLSGFFIILSIFLIFNKFLVGIHQGVSFASAVSRGDLTKTLHVMSRDEVGELSDALNKMSLNLQFMLKQVKLSTVELSSLIEQNYRFLEDITKGEQLQAESFNQMSLSLKGLDTSIRIISGKTEEIFGLSEKANKNALSGKESVNEMLKEMKNIRGSSDKVYEFLNIMKEIADKTNMIALNAVLSASRGGWGNEEVTSLAMEIKKLAERSSNSISQIEKVINTNLEIFNRASGAVQEANTSFNVFHTDIEGIVKLTDEINNLMTGQKKESEHIICLRSRVNEINNENIHKVNALINFTNTLSRQTETLKDLIKKFHIAKE